MNLPNWITVSRILITVGCFLCLGMIPDPSAPTAALGWWAFGLFIFAAVTDFLDGYLARSMQQVTAFGRVADPFADKLLICGSMIILLEFPVAFAIMPAWFVVIVVARELLVTTLRGVSEAAGIPFPADPTGKLKMLVQCVTVSALLSLVAGTEVFREFAVWGVWVTLVLTVYSGVSYTWRARQVLFS
ncbi:MAG: CDP-diacylglycerol--glycerol-3-phosphate 3-phosphatidyltransferase [Planctomycetota bacterium]